MTHPVLRDPSVPARLPHVEERHARIEEFRPIMLQRAANARFAAAQLEFTLCNMPDNDEAVDYWAGALKQELSILCDMGILYREMRDIKGEG